MTDIPDAELLADFSRSESEEAFAELVRRHIALVHSVALRHTVNPQSAQEITQAVFIILARKAASLGRNVVLSGWLYHTARLTAANFRRAEFRRVCREQEAYMQSTLEENSPDAAWLELSPLLDDAMARLGATDRDAVVLRYFENKSLSEVGAALGMEERTAQKRVLRAVEKLRKIFTKRGVTLTATLIASAVTANSVQAAPVGLAATVTAAAKGAAVSGSTLTFIKGTLKIMAWTKAKMAVAVGVGVLLAAGTTTVLVEKAAHPKLSKTDLSWADDPRYWEVNSSVLEQIPSGVFIFRPTRFTSGGGVYVGDRLMTRNSRVHDLLGTAFGFPYTRTIFPVGLPREHFDVMVTFTNRSNELLREELEQRFGLTARRETREMDVLLLKVKNPNAPGLKPHEGDDGNSSWIGGNRKVDIKNQQPDGFFGNIETTIGQIVLNRTGLTGRYDIHLQWKPQPGEPDKNAFKRALLDQLGLELVPIREPVEMLIVEKVK